MSLNELEQHWSLIDLLEAHMALDVRDELMARSHEKAERDAEIEQRRRQQLGSA